MLLLAFLFLMTSLLLLGSLLLLASLLMFLSTMFLLSVVALDPADADVLSAISVQLVPAVASLPVIADISAVADVPMFAGVSVLVDIPSLCFYRVLRVSLLFLASLLLFTCLFLLHGIPSVIDILSAKFFALTDLYCISFLGFKGTVS
jgi:hypothetical protein